MPTVPSDPDLNRNELIRTPLRRCSLPADGFFEWRRSGKEKQLFHFGMRNDSLFAFAGLWDRWRDLAGAVIESCTVLTTIPNSPLADVHDRMPVILSQETYDLWLDPGFKDVKALAEVLAPFDATKMRNFPVSKRINAVANDDPDCITPIQILPRPAFGPSGLSLAGPTRCSQSLWLPASCGESESVNPILSRMRFALILALSAVCTFAQEPLRQQVRTIAADAHGKVSVACSLPGSALNCDLNPNAKPPMQSVFKLPLGLTVLHQVERGTLSLDQPVRFLPQDRILPHVYSPLQDQYPDAGVDVPLRELLRLTVSLSDNVAADILLRVVVGPKAVNTYIASLGFRGFHLRDNEAVLHQEVSAQYRNWFEPAGAVQLLRRVSDNSPLTIEHTDLLLGWMTPDVRTKRLEGDLPAGVRVAHKSGTSDVDKGLAHATNDIGLIPLPDGRRIAIAVFVTDSTADQAIREQVVARIARAANDASLKSTSSSR